MNEDGNDPGAAYRVREGAGEGITLAAEEAAELQRVFLELKDVGDQITRSLDRIHIHLQGMVDLSRTI